MEKIHLGSIDYTILLVYIAFVLGIGFALKRFMKTSTDFFLSGRSIPAWVAGLAFISANLARREVIGMGASGAKYGIMHQPFLLAGRDSGDGLRRHLHDALLLWLEGPLGARILEASVRRKDPRLQRAVPLPS